MDPLIAGSQLYAGDILPLADRNRNNEVAKDIRAVGRKCVRLGHRDDEIRDAKTPPSGPLRARWEISRVAFRSAPLGPGRDRRDLLAGQSALGGERPAKPWCRLPGGHVASACHVDDLPGAWPDIGVRQQAERCARSRAVTREAVLEDDRRHVPGEGRRARVLARRRARARERDQHDDEENPGRSHPHEPRI